MEAPLDWMGNILHNVWNACQEARSALGEQSQEEDCASIYVDLSRRFMNLVQQMEFYVCDFADKMFRNLNSNTSAAPGFEPNGRSRRWERHDAASGADAEADLCGFVIPLHPGLRMPNITVASDSSHTPVA